MSGRGTRSGRAGSSRRRRLAALLLSGLIAACGHRPEPAPPDELYRALALPAAGGGSLRSDELRGKVVLISFFATWCFPCIADLPVLERLQERHGAEGFTVLMVGMDLEGQAVIAPFAQHYALPFPVVVADAALREGRTPFGRITALPTYVLVDREGKVALAYSGVASPKGLFRAVEGEVRR